MTIEQNPNVFNMEVFKKDLELGVEEYAKFTSSRRRSHSWDEKPNDESENRMATENKTKFEEISKMVINALKQSKNKEGVLEATHLAFYEINMEYYRYGDNRPIISPEQEAIFFRDIIVKLF